MTGTASVLLAVTAVFAVLDWIAVATGRRVLEYVAKPSTTAGLIAVALALDPGHGGMRAAFVVALVCSLVGDVALMLPRDAFVAGLASFVLAHVAYAVGFVIGPGDATELVIGAFVAAVVVLPLGSRLLRTVAATDAALVAPVAAYLAVISVMVACATAWGNGWAIAGAWLFFASDALIGETRFVRPAHEHGPAWRLAIMVTYHLGQAGLVVSLVQ